MPIYCDEAGSNGNDLLEAIQPYFTYAALNISEEEATETANFLKNKYRLQGNEPKGVNMVKTRDGRSALLELFERYSNNVKILYHHKKFALSCKFFEYIFEPVIAEVNSFFYRAEFNKFIANFLFDIIERKGDSAEMIYVKFQDLVRGNDFKGLFEVLNSSIDDNKSVRHIFGFAYMHRDKIRDELLIAGKAQQWVLDLAQSAFYDLMIKWQMEMPELTVLCDESKPLKHLVENSKSLFLPNQDVKMWNPMGKGEIPLNIKLTEPIKFLKSNKSKGLQLADMFASSAYFFLKNPNDEFSERLSPYLEKKFLQTRDRTIMPQPEKYLYGSLSSAKLHKDMLKQLYDLTLKGRKDIGQSVMRIYLKK